MPVKPAANAMMLSLVVALATLSASPVRAADITIFLNQATASGVRELAAGFEKATGHKVDVSFQVVGPALNQKIVSGAPGDLVSLGLDQFDDYIKQGKVVAGSVVEYARVGNGVAAEAGAAGDVEIGIQQTNVIQPVAGSEYLGPLPAELMEYARVGVGLLAVSQQQEVANAFIKFMADPANAALLRKGDMEPPAR